MDWYVSFLGFDELPQEWLIDNFSILRSDFSKRMCVNWTNLQVYLGIQDLDEYENIE